MRAELELNRRHWDEATRLHVRGNVYGVEDFKAGECCLHRVEVEELGADVRDKSLLHPQCQFGLDTLSWARRGARVTGVDYSPAGIEAARQLSAETGVAGTFVCYNLYELAEALKPPESFDIVFTSYGVMNWLPDLTRWAQLIAHFLKPGGIFYMVEAHPFARVFPIDDDVRKGAQPMRPCFGYFHDPAGTYWPPSNDYADEAATHTVGEHCWQHTAGDVVNALIGAGLVIEWLHEFAHCPWPVVAGCEVIERYGANKGDYGLPKSAPQLPLIFSIRARKP